MDLATISLGTMAVQAQSETSSVFDRAKDWINDNLPGVTFDVKTSSSSSSYEYTATQHLIVDSNGDPILDGNGDPQIYTLKDLKVTGDINETNLKSILQAKLPDTDWDSIMN